MHDPRLHSLGLAALALALLPQPSGAQGERRDETERWVPAAGFSFEVIGQPSAGAVESGDFRGPPRSDGGCEEEPGRKVFGPCREPVPSALILTPNVSDSDTTTAALVGLSLELMTPGLASLPTHPRLFARAEAALVFGFRRKLAGDGDPGALALPPRLANVEGSSSNVGEDTISGQGNRAFSEVQNPVFSVGAGLAFTLDLWGRRLRVKPSFEYMMQQVEFSGLASRAIQVFGSDDPRPSRIEHFRRLSFSASKTRTHHGLGGGLEIEADTQRLGPFILSVYASGRFYHLLGDLDEILTSDQNEIGPSFPGESVTWRFEPENRIWRGGVGLRFRFVPR